MVYNARQYDAARDFLGKMGSTPGGTDNIVDVNDKLRAQCYDLYENIYNNSTFQLKVTIRGDETHPILLPSGEKLIESVNRFLAINLDYLVEGKGDAGTQKTLDDWFKDWFAREKIKAKFESSKRYGLIRADAVLYIYANPTKDAGKRICVHELDPRQLMAIANPTDIHQIVGYHIIERVQDFRSPDDKSKTVTKRRTFRKELDDNGNPTGTVTTELSYWTNAKWDDRTLKPDELEAIPGGPDAEPPTPLPSPISELPIYKWRTKPPQNSDWGVSQLSGLESIMYAINQSLTDEDATLLFQGLGMYVTSAAPPIDPNTGQITNWNIGPQQIIEIGTDQKFERVSGITDLKPSQDHIQFMADASAEAKGIPQIAIGKVDVNAVQSGIALKMELMPLIAANAEKELEIINVLDQMFHDVTTQWLPAYESETFANADAMSQMSVVCIFDDPIPVDRDAAIQETLLLETSNLILTSMAVGKLRELGWKYPTTDDQGNALTDDDIAQMLKDQTTAAATAADPFAAQAGNMSAFDQATGTPPPGGAPGANGQPQPPKPGPQNILLPSQ